MARRDLFRRLGIDTDAEGLPPEQAPLARTKRARTLRARANRVAGLPVELTMATKAYDAAALEGDFETARRMNVRREALRREIEALPDRPAVIAARLRRQATREDLKQS